MFTDKSREILQNKAIDGGEASPSRYLELPSGTTAELAELPRREGSLAYDTTLNAVVCDNGSGFSAVDTDSDEQLAAEVAYDNVASSLTAENVQDAIDELAVSITDVDADEVSYDNVVSGLTATDVQAAIDELAAIPAGASVEEDTFEATFTQGIGAVTVSSVKIGTQVTLQIPYAFTADGGAANSLDSGATDIPAGLRPAVDLYFAAIVTHGGTEELGIVYVSTAGLIQFFANEFNAFTDDAPAGWPGLAITYLTA